jgi:hypothetical protein
MIPIMCLSLYGNCATDLRGGKMPNGRRNNKLKTGKGGVIERCY